MCLIICLTSPLRGGRSYSRYNSDHKHFFLYLVAKTVSGAFNHCYKNGIMVLKKTVSCRRHKKLLKQTHRPNLDWIQSRQISTDVFQIDNNFTFPFCWLIGLVSWQKFCRWGKYQKRYWIQLVCHDKEGNKSFVFMIKISNIYSSSEAKIFLINK